ncbi:COG4315 family predicted lipoprotein [Microbacterium hominis]|uniref:Lipoprotein n=1 Tax=Microbacterium hominis TaxID=162426 RepID=A0A7D4Q0B5_9MICO|nr:hypothetical protein [Microbacterium hominis]QKJ19072.1 hypothetical protein HQM25_06585 [Microbacterium hominis]
MTTKLARIALATAVLAFALAGCTSPPADDTSTDTDTGTSQEAEDTTTEDEGTDDSGDAAGEAELMVAETSLGEVVVDADGMTVYMFDNDTQDSGVSSCEGQCLENWPPVTTESDAPAVDGVSGEVGTITGTDGSTQVTLNGWPLYYFIGDEAAGDVNGQAVNDVWWVLTPDGERFAG